MPARKACWFMNTNHFITFGTNPSQFFILNEISDPSGMYHFEISNHAHSILGSVSLIQLFHPGTWEIITATGAVLGISFSDLFAVSDFTGSTVF